MALYETPANAKDIVMEENTIKFFTSALAKDIARVLILNTVATIGVFGGMIAVGATIEKVQNLKAKKTKTALAK